MANGQDNHKLSGRITDCKLKTGIAKVTVKLVSSTGINVETLSDSLGFYYFNDSLLKPNVSYVIATLAPVNEDDLRKPYGNCPYKYLLPKGTRYMNTSDKAKMKTDDSLKYKNYVHDFCLQELYHYYIGFPNIYFEKNSDVFAKDKVYEDNFQIGADSTLDCLVDLMLTNPGFVIKVCGHADKHEKQTQKLSEQRAEKVYNLLVAKGIEKERLQYKGYGAEHALEFIYTPYDSKELKKYVGPKNQNVGFAIVRKDYPTLLPKKDDSIINSEEED